jgi:hypothetical protein
MNHDISGGSQPSRSHSRLRRIIDWIGEGLAEVEPHTKRTLICCSLTSAGWTVRIESTARNQDAYQVADHDLALRLDVCRRHRDFVVLLRGLGRLLDTTDGGDSWLDSSTNTAASAKRARVLAASRDDGVKRLVKLSRHLEDGLGLLVVGWARV